MCWGQTVTAAQNIFSACHEITALTPASMVLREAIYSIARLGKRSKNHHFNIYMQAPTTFKPQGTLFFMLIVAFN